MVSLKMDDGEGIHDDDAPESWGWGVVRSVIQDGWMALCFDCDWRGDLFFESADAGRQLRQHLTTAAHQVNTPGGP